MKINLNGIGKVYLVGAGPGDPGLLTLKARDLIEAADCIIYDNLVNIMVFEHANSDAEAVYVGKRGHKGGGESWDQQSINRLLAEKAAEYKVVVRLKGGDPFIFGRGGEEAEYLSDLGIEWEIVPGVSAGSAVAAYAGIPITHRGVASSVAFVTGNEDPSKPTSSIRWEHLANGVDTLVIFMGLSNVSEIADKLIHNGRNADVPVAVISWGTYSHQETVVGTLADIANKVEEKSLESPALIIVGEVVRLRNKLKWFEEQKSLKELAANPFFELLAG